MSVPGRNHRRGGEDLGFRLGTGLFTGILIVIVMAIGYELARQSRLSIEKVGLEFWRTQVWDPVAGQFGALPCIWGTLYSSPLALRISVSMPPGTSVCSSELCPHWMH